MYGEYYGAHRPRRLPWAVRMALAAPLAAAAPLAVAHSTATPTNAPQNQTTPATSTAQKQSKSTVGTAENAQNLQAVVVTGTHIRAAGLATQQPISVVTHEQIVKSGLTTVGAVLQNMTVTGIAGQNRQQEQGPDNAGQGGSFLNLRYLGSARVLVLVNGKRWVTNAQGATNLRTIPASVIQRIEVLKDGASAIYGSDAVTGVVNIITRKHFNGARVNVGYGTTQKGDNTHQHIDLMFGTTHGKLSIMSDLSYNHVGPMWSRTRDITRFGSGGIYHPTTHFRHISPRGRFTSSRGTFILGQLGADATNLANYKPIDLRNYPLSATYNQFQVKQFRIPSTQVSLFAHAQYDVNDNLSIVTTEMYTRYRASAQIGPWPLSGGLLHGSAGEISKESIYNPTNEDIHFAVIFPNRPRHTVHHTNSMHANVGLKGKFRVGEFRTWHWNAFINYNKLFGRTRLHNMINLRYLSAGIGPSFINKHGVPTCGTPSNPHTNQKQFPCNPINILAGSNGLTPTISKNLFANVGYDFHYLEKGAEANVSGGLFPISVGGEVRFALGANVRKTTAFRRAGLQKRRLLTTSAGAETTDGEFSVQSAYAELNIPVLRNLPGVKLLDFDLATRYSRYSTFGSTTNSKIGFQYRPIGGLLFRATWAQAFRAPTVADTSGGVSNGYDSYTDPCDAKFGAQIYGEAAQEACVSELRNLGIPNPEHFREISHTGSPITAPNQEGGELFFFGPAPNLGPETAKTLTAGFVYSPVQVQGLNVGVTWWKIKLDNLIQNVTANDILRGCYVLQNQDDCNNFSRNETGQVINLFTGLRNLGSETVEGWDFNFSYTLPTTPVGQFTVRTEGTYYQSIRLQRKPGKPAENLLGWISGGPHWKIRDNTSVVWKKGHLSAAWTLHYFSSLREPCAYGTEFECNMPNYHDAFRGHSATDEVGSVTFSDLRLTWTSGSFGSVTVGARNVFNRQPPITYSAGGGTSAPILAAYPVGRYFYTHYQLQF